MSKPVTKDPLAALLRKQREEALEAGQSSEPAAKEANSSLIKPLITPVDTPVDTLVDASVIPKLNNQAQYLDATHTASEQRIYSVMCIGKLSVRESVNDTMDQASFARRPESVLTRP